MTKAARYGAFISYSHSASAEVADGLQKWLQTYAKPSPSQSETDVTIAASLNSRSASHNPRTQRPLSFASIGRGTRRCRSRDLRPPGGAFLRL